MDSSVLHLTEVSQIASGVHPPFGEGASGSYAQEAGLANGSMDPIGSHIAQRCREQEPTVDAAAFYRVDPLAQTLPEK